jgi:hypothetical protein
MRALAALAAAPLERATTQHRLPKKSPLARAGIVGREGGSRQGGKGVRPRRKRCNEVNVRGGPSTPRRSRPAAQARSAAAPAYPGESVDDRQAKPELPGSPPCRRQMRGPAPPTQRARQQPQLTRCGAEPASMYESQAWHRRGQLGVAFHGAKNEGAPSGRQRRRDEARILGDGSAHGQMKRGA